MILRARLFRNGGSQAVRLPKACRFPEATSEVLVHQEGRRIILELPDEWPEAFLKCLGGWDAPIPRQKQKPISKLRNPFA